MRKAGGNPLEYLKYTFTDLIIAMVSPSGSQGGEIASRESIELSFSTVKQEYVDLIVAVVSPSGSHDGEIASRETVELSFSTVKQEYVVQNQQGGSGGTITAGYDFKANKEI
ncbi:hemolysin-coregulated protein [Salmonella enterica subsp. enterica serovar Cerro str. FSL R8-0235]|nr:hemolysin-coregulated protein [Salmonella enterica subsp. enterica serovar Cerro str. FSL R8-0235]